MRGAIYARYSTSKQNPKSIRDQIQVCRSYAQREGIEVIKEYTDEEKSGYSAFREGLIELLKDAERGVFDILLVEHTSRLARDGYELRRLLNEFMFRYNIPIIFVSQNLRTDREQDVTAIKLFNIVDEQYVEGIRIATKRGLEGLFWQGKWTGGSLPFGYATRDGYLTLKDDEAEIVRWIFEEYALGKGLKTICKELNNKGIKTKKGNVWSTSTLSTLIKNPIYKGIVIWGRRRFIRDPLTGRVRVYKNKEFLQRTAPELAIIPIELWEKCNKKLAEVPHGKPKARRIHPLHGIVKCGLCGYHFARESGKLYCSSHRTRKSCTNDISIDYTFMFKWVVAQLKRFVDMNRETITQKIEEIKKGRSVSDTEKELYRLKNKLKNLYDLYSEDPNDILKKQINEVKQRIQFLERDVLNMNVGYVRLEKALENFEKILTSKAEEANQILKLFCEEILITPKDGIINIQVKQGSNLSKILGLREIAGGGFEPPTSGL